MDRIKTVREALLADLLGEAMELTRRVEALPPVVGEARDALIDAAESLTSKVVSIEERLDALVANAPRRVADLIIRAASDARRGVIEEQSRAMAEASRKVVAHEVEPALRGVAAKLAGLGRQHVADCVLQAAIGAVAGIVSSLCTTVLVLRFLVH